jgi:hypothetical protein
MREATHNALDLYLWWGLADVARHVIDTRFESSVLVLHGVL